MYRLILYEGKALRFQVVEPTVENMVVVSGSARLSKGKEVINLGQRESADLLLDQPLDIENRGKGMLELVQISTAGPLKGSEYESL